MINYESSLTCLYFLKLFIAQTLVQQYLFIPAKWKDCYLAYLLDEFKGQSTIIFVATCNNALRITLLLRNLGFNAVCLHGQLSQPKRLGALNKFKSGQRNILVATDVASRGLDIPNVDIVLNFDIPSHGKDYVHRYVLAINLKLRFFELSNAFMNALKSYFATYIGLDVQHVPANQGDLWHL